MEIKNDPDYDPNEEGYLVEVHDSETDEVIYKIRVNYPHDIDARRGSRKYMALGRFVDELLLDPDNPVYAGDFQKITKQK